MATSFDNLTIQRAARLLPSLTVDQKMNAKFVVERDGWQSGEGWIGPRPDPQETGYAEFMIALARAFVWIDALAEIASNRSDAIIGKEPNWFWTLKKEPPEGEEPSEEQQALLDEANALSTKWWNDRGAHSLLKEAVTAMIWAERAGLRLYVPSAIRLQDMELDEETGERVPVGEPYIRATDFEEALSYIHLDQPKPETFGVYEDPDTKEKIGILRVERSGRVHYEVSYYDSEEEHTVLRIVGSGRDEQETFELGKDRLFHFEAKHPMVISGSMRRLQMALNLSQTLLTHNMSLTSFVERTMLNAQMPGDWQYDKDGRKIPGTFTPKPYKVGPSQTNFVRGIEYESVDADGTIKTTLTSPQIDRRDPPPVLPIIEGKDDVRRELFRQAKQEHLASKSDAESSGFAYEQRRAAFLASLGETAAPTVEMVRWLIETSMALAEDIRGERRFTETLRVEVQLRLNKGPISSETEKANWEAAEKGHLPLTEALSRNGTDDPDAAILQIEAQPWYQIRREKEIAEMVAAWTTAGASLEAAIERLRKIDPSITDEDVRKLLGGDREEETGVRDPNVDTDPDADAIPPA